MELIEFMVIAGFVISFFLAFGIGANDVANSFGTSVGSKVLTLKQACILATIFEILGSILIGAKVSGTIRKGIFDPNEFNGSENELMLGYVSALASCCIWLIVATILNLPVSGTHSIVGATIGMALVSKGYSILAGWKIAEIVASWFISPLISGLVSVLLFIIIRRFILRAENPLNAGLRFLPIIYTLTIVINVGGVLEASPALLKFDKIPWWGKVIIAVGVAIIVYLSVWLILVPRMRKSIMNANALKEENKINCDLQNKKVEMDETNSRACGTQVDHIALLVDTNDYEEKMFKNSDRQQPFASEFHATKEMPKIKKLNANLRKRHRLDSEPAYLATGAAVDSDYSGDVNFTLSGYLHTIHSFRQYLQQHRQHLTTTSSSGSAQHHPLAIGRVAKQQGPNTTDQAHQQRMPLLANMFNRQTSVPNESQNNKSDLGNDASNQQAANANENTYDAGKKVGRFFTKPAKVDDEQSKAERISDKGSMLEIDQEVEENIYELPETEKKKPTEIDEFANADPPEAAKLFSFLQILTAVFGSFAHGGNDVSNAIGPLIGLYLLYQDRVITTSAETPEWILFYGGVGISVGLWVLGRRVIKTIGEDLTKITPSSGFVIEIASAMTVLFASLLKIPVSTTHCKVGSVVFTGRIRAKQSVDWSLFRNIIAAWLVTVPVTGGIAAAFQATFKAIFIK